MWKKCGHCTVRGGLRVEQTVPGIHRVSCVLSWLQPHSDRLPYGTSACCSSQIAHGNLDTHKVFHLQRDIMGSYGFLTGKLKHFQRWLNQNLSDNLRICHQIYIITTNLFTKNNFHSKSMYIVTLFNLFKLTLIKHFDHDHLMFANSNKRRQLRFLVCTSDCVDETLNKHQLSVFHIHSSH